MTGTMEDPRKVCGTAICQLAKENKRMVLLSADSGKSSGFGEFIDFTPERYFEFGIMEQAVTGIAAGLATSGKIPVFCAIAPFVTARNFEMFRNDLGYMHQNAKVIGRNGGITYSDLGSTHHSLDDFAIIRMIPGVVIICPEDPNEIRAACRAMVAHEGPVYMRIGNGKIPNVLPEQEFIIGKGRHISDGEDVTLISTGSTIGMVLQAANMLMTNKIHPEIIGLPTIYPLDESLILSSAQRTRRVVVVEEHYVYGGLGTMVSDLLAEKLPTRVLKLGIPHDYATTGPYDEILEKYGLTPQHITDSVMAFCRV